MSTTKTVDQVWAIFAPDGTFDGGIHSPETIEQAQRILARPKRWATLARGGWEVRAVSRDEFRALTDAMFPAEASR